jgi:hypothetical protein
MNFTQVFKLDFNIPESSKKINLNDSIFLLGSCFSDEIGKQLNENKLNSFSNPFGTIYNPHSIFKLLANQVSVNQVVESQEVFYHWDTHGAISGLCEQEVVDEIDRKLGETQDFLKKAEWLIITLGTSIVYEHKKVGIVANCHKTPSSQFTKRFLSQEEIIQSFSNLHSYLTNHNPELNILFTVSPVRHIRDGLVENNRSKAILIDAIHSITERYSNVGYFPSYEIVNDELRDYRFFKKDRIHPTDEATEYVWKQFTATYFDKETIDFLAEWSKIKTAINHRPFQPKSATHQQFIKTTLSKLEKLNEKVDVSVEMEQLRSQVK